MGKPKKQLAPAKVAMPEPSRVLEVSRLPGCTDLESIAAQCLDPQNRGASLASALAQETMGKTDLMGSVKAVRATVAASKAGDTSFSDEMLIAHAYVLDSLFGDCLRRWQANAGHNWQISQGYLNAAMKAQAQARMALETLAKIKNPATPTFIRQANMANGPQQVNNGCEPARAIQNQPNEILGGFHRGMDSGAAAEAVRSDTPVGTMAESHRAEVGGGEGKE
jgi:hypothetical protein